MGATTDQDESISASDMSPAAHGRPPPCTTGTRDAQFKLYERRAYPPFALVAVCYSAPLVTLNRPGPIYLWHWTGTAPASS